MLHAMIMAGGGGTRFWPRSRQARPKQFLAVTGERTLLQLALDRIEGCALPASQVWVLTGQDYTEETKRQLPEVPAEQVVGEPCGRDTAACIALGAALIERKDPDGVMLVTPADHIIEPVQEFRRAVHVAEQMAREHAGALITFGIRPTFASTGYGYIQRGEHLGQRQGVQVFRVTSFKEKPKQALAEQFAASGEYYWNSGIFVWKVATILEAIRKNRPAMHEAMKRIAEGWGGAQGKDILDREYPHLEKISIDYAVLERHKEVLVVEAPYRWDDVGSWLAVERLHPQDAQGNTILGEHLGLHTNGCVVVGETGRMIATVGVQDLLIIQDGECTLVAHRSREGEVKQLVEELRARKQERYL